MEKYIREKRELVYQGAIVSVYRDSVRVPKGNLAKWDFIGHKGAAAALPVTEEGKIILVKQWRNALDRFTYEIPAGGKEAFDEPMEICAGRELEEETGYVAEHMELLLSIYTTVAFCNEKIDIFLAKDLRKTSQNMDEDEDIEIFEFELSELLAMIRRGELQDSKTVSAILAYDAYCREHA